MSYQMFLGRFTIGALDFTVGATACQIDAGSYFLYGYTGEATNQLCEAIQAEIRAETAHSGATVVFDPSTERVTITLDSTDSITWDDTALADILGYTSESYSESDEYEAEQNPRYCWFPSRPIAKAPHYIDAANFWVERSQSFVQRSENGTTYGLSGELLYDATIQYMFLAAADTIRPTTGSVYEDFQQFWVDVIHQTQPFRIIMDKTSYAVTTDYVTAIVGKGEGDNLGSFAEFKERHIENYNGLWNITLPLWKYVQ